MSSAVELGLIHAVCFPRHLGRWTGHRALASSIDVVPQQTLLGIGPLSSDNLTKSSISETGECGLLTYKMVFWEIGVSRENFQVIFPQPGIRWQRFQEIRFQEIHGKSSCWTGRMPGQWLQWVTDLEFSNLEWNRIFEEPVEFSGGFAYAPERIGHGLTLDRDAVEHFSRAD